jgi:hypothetical protein
MRRPTGAYLLLSLTSLLILAACNREGVGGFAPGGRVAIVRAEDRLYTANADGGDVALITDALGFGFGTSFSPDGGRILYVDQQAGGACLAPADGSGPPECTSLALEAENGGILTFLPDGHILLGYESEDSRFRLLIFNESWEPVHEAAGIDHFFISQNSFKAKRGHDGTEWYLRPYASGQPLRWVITRDEQAFAYSATASGVEGPVELPAAVGPAMQDALANREAGDLTSGAVGPDGGAIVFRTREPGNRYSLYLVNMQQANGELVELVDRARFRVEYVFSPDGSQIAYESDADGRSIWIAAADGSDPRELADNAALPAWQ